MDVLHATQNLVEKKLTVVVLQRGSPFHHHTIWTSTLAKRLPWNHLTHPIFIKPIILEGSGVLSTCHELFEASHEERWWELHPADWNRVSRWLELRTNWTFRGSLFLVQIHQTLMESENLKQTVILLTPTLDPGFRVPSDSAGISGSMPNPWSSALCPVGFQEPFLIYILFIYIYSTYVCIYIYIITHIICNNKPNRGFRWIWLIIGYTGIPQYRTFGSPRDHFWTTRKSLSAFASGLAGNGDMRVQPAKHWDSTRFNQQT